jgi:hypothetical protein
VRASSREIRRAYSALRAPFSSSVTSFWLAGLFRQKQIPYGDHEGSVGAARYEHGIGFDFREALIAERAEA